MDLKAILQSLVDLLQTDFWPLARKKKTQKKDCALTRKSRKNAETWPKNGSQMGFGPFVPFSGYFSHISLGRPKSILRPVFHGIGPKARTQSATRQRDRKPIICESGNLDYRDTNWRCIAVLFKSTAVRGRCDSPAFCCDKE